MEKRTLGRTGLLVSEVGFGAWAIGGNRYGNSYGLTDDAASRAAIPAFQIRRGAISPQERFSDRPEVASLAGRSRSSA